MRALVTNDDGVGAPGVWALAETAVEAGLEVTVVAPDWDTSGASASLTAVQTEGRPVSEPLYIDGMENLRAFSVRATPAFIVRAAVTGYFGPAPRIVLSGINDGLNTGHAVLHSGTVGAALTASAYGRPAAAFSLEKPASAPPNWETAAAVTRVVIGWLVDMNRHVVLNVKVPNTPLAGLRGLRQARLTRGGAVQSHVTETDEGYVKLECSDERPDLEPESDAGLLRRRFACFTTLTAPCESTSADLGGLARPSWR